MPNASLTNTWIDRYSPQELATGLAHATELLVDWLCGFILDAVDHAVTLTPIDEEHTDAGLDAVAAWRPHAPFGMISLCGRYLFTDQITSSGYCQRSYYRVLRERPATPEAFLALDQASYQDSFGNWHCPRPWSEILDSLIAMDQIATSHIATAMGVDIPDDDEGEDRFHDGAALLATEAVQLAFAAIEAMSWEVLTQRGQRECAAIQDARAAAHSSARARSEAVRQLREERQALARVAIPRFIGEVERRARTPVDICHERLLTKDSPLWPYTRDVLRRLAPKEREAIVTVLGASNSVRAEFGPRF